MRDIQFNRQLARSRIVENRIDRSDSTGDARTRELTDGSKFSRVSAADRGNAGTARHRSRGSYGFHKHARLRRPFARARAQISRRERLHLLHVHPAATPRDVLTEWCRGASKTGRRATGASDSVGGGWRGEGDC